MKKHLLSWTLAASSLFAIPSAIYVQPILKPHPAIQQLGNFQPFCMVTIVDRNSSTLGYAVTLTYEVNGTTYSQLELVKHIDDQAASYNGVGLFWVPASALNFKATVVPVATVDEHMATSQVVNQQ